MKRITSFLIKYRNELIVGLLVFLFFLFRDLLKMLK